MKILIAADMEGITGVTNWDHVDPGHSEYARFRRAMTAEVNAAVRGAFDGGASEVTVADGHSRGCNILVEELDERARLHSGTFAPFSMVQGIDESVNGVMYIGYHARAGTARAILDHTWATRVMGVWLNDVLVGEAGLNAAVCGHFGAPVILVSGDQAVCAELTSLLGEVETMEVKHASSRFSAEHLPAGRARQLIESGAKRAVQRLKEGKGPKPYQPARPVQVTLEFNQSDMVDAAMRVPGTTRLDGRRMRFEAADMPEAYRTFRAAVALAGS